MTRRVRFGLRWSSIFPNVGIFVLKMSESDFAQLSGAVDAVRQVLIRSKNEKIEAKIVLELS